MAHERISFSDRTIFRSMGDHAQRYRFAAQKLGGCQIADIACGVGYGSRLLRDAGATSVVGVDRSADAIREAKQLFARDGITFMRGKAEEVDSLLKEILEVEAIVSFETLEHLEQQEDFIKRLSMTLKPSGQLFISTPNVTARDPSVVSSSTRNPYHFHEMTLEEFETNLRKYFGSVSIFGQWQTWDCKLRLIQERERFETMCDLYWNPLLRIGRWFGSLYGRKCTPPQSFGGGDNYSWDFEIHEIEAHPFPWLPSTLIAVCVR